jgi:glycosyltransferase involved in cell wall biosynthesis
MFAGLTQKALRVVVTAAFRAEDAGVSEATEGSGRATWETPGLNSRLKLLIITHSFPPDIEVGGLRAARFARYLPEFGIQPIVLTIEDRYREKLDNTAQSIAGIQVERTEVKQMPVDWYRHSKTRLGVGKVEGSVGAASVQAERPKSLIRRHMAMMLQFPGPNSGWYGPAVEAGKKLIEKESIDAIISSSPPAVSHRIALRLKSECRVPWIADFRDPWAQSAYWNDGPWWWRKTNKVLESRCIRAADRVICNTEWLRHTFVRFYSQLPPQKFVTITNGFEDSSALDGIGTEPRRERLILHLGSIYALRRIDTFCKAVSGLVKTGKVDPATFKIIFLGHIEPSLEAAARVAAPELFQQGRVELRARVDRHEAHKALWQADILLLFQGSHSLQIPAKFYEYLPTGRPILTVAQKGALTDVLDETGAGIWADPDNAEEIATQFLRALSLPALSSIEAQTRWRERFHYRSLTERLAICCRDVVDESRRPTRP